MLLFGLESPGSHATTASIIERVAARLAEIRAAGGPVTAAAPSEKPTTPTKGTS